MLTRKLACPSCGVNLRVADTLPAGKRIKCPKCGIGFPVPADEDPPPSPVAVAVRTRKAAPPPEEDDRDDEVEERPVARKRRKKPKKAARNVPLVVGLVLGGALLLAGVAVTLAAVFRPAAKKAEPVAANNPSRPGPVEPGAGAGPGPVEPGPGPRGDIGAGAAGAELHSVAAGRQVFAANNCSRCHAIGGSGGPPGGGPAAGGGRMGRIRGPDLGRTGADPTHTVEWLMAHIRNPKSHKPDSRMPAFGNINDQDLRALAEYLASLK
jgi:mono/diheme cytochrome c family protein